MLEMNIFLILWCCYSILSVVNIVVLLELDDRIVIYDFFF